MRDAGVEVDAMRTVAKAYQDRSLQVQDVTMSSTCILTASAAQRHRCLHFASLFVHYT